MHGHALASTNWASTTVEIGKTLAAGRWMVPTAEELLEPMAKKADDMQRNKPIDKRMASRGKLAVTAGQPSHPPSRCALVYHLGLVEEVHRGRMVGTRRRSVVKAMNGMLSDEWGGKFFGDGFNATAAGLRGWELLEGSLHMGGPHVMVAIIAEFEHQQDWGSSVGDRATLFRDSIPCIWRGGPKTRQGEESVPRL